MWLCQPKDRENRWVPESLNWASHTNVRLTFDILFYTVGMNVCLRVSVSWYGIHINLYNGCWIVPIPKREFRITFYFKLSCHARIGLNGYTHTHTHTWPNGLRKSSAIFEGRKHARTHSSDFSTWLQNWINCDGMWYFATEKLIAFVLVL